MRVCECMWRYECECVCGWCGCVLGVLVCVWVGLQKKRFFFFHVFYLKKKRVLNAFFFLFVFYLFLMHIFYPSCKQGK